MKLRQGQWVQGFSDIKGRISGFVVDPRRDRDGDIRIVDFDRHGVGQLYVEVDSITPPSRRRPDWTLLVRMRRRDGHVHYAFASPDGAKVVIVAGCRTFASFDRARAHWSYHSRDWSRRDGKQSSLTRFSLEFVVLAEKAAKRFRRKVK